MSARIFFKNFFLVKDMHSSSQESRLFQPGSMNRSPLRGSSFSKENRVARRRSMERATDSNTKAENYFRARITRNPNARDKTDSMFEEKFSEKRRGYNKDNQEEEDDFSWIEERERMNGKGSMDSGSRYSWYSHGDSHSGSRSPSRSSYRGSRSASPARGGSRSASRDRYEHHHMSPRHHYAGRGYYYDRNSSRSASPKRSSSRSASPNHGKSSLHYYNRNGTHHDRNSSRSASPKRSASQERSSQVSWRPIRSSNVASNCRHESQEWSSCGQNRHHHTQGCGCYRCKAHAHNEKLVHTYKDHTAVTTPCGTEHAVYTKKDTYQAQQHARADSKTEEIELREALNEYNAWAVKNNSPELTMEDVLRTKRGASMERSALPRGGTRYGR